MNKKLKSDASILLIDDEVKLCSKIHKFLTREGYNVTATTSGKEGLERISRNRFDIVVTDLKMPEIDGFMILDYLTSNSPETLVIIMTAYSSYESTIKSLKGSAFDYLMKPFSFDMLLHVIHNALEKVTLQTEIRELKDSLFKRHSFGSIIGKSPQMQEIYRQIQDLSQIDSTVLISGDTGTGKELVARTLHYNSPRRNKPFVVINCAAISETLLESEIFGHEKGAFTGANHLRIGKFEYANGGSVFLDEIGEVPMQIQSKLLRVLQEKEFERIGGNKTIHVDVRIISATNRDLSERIKEGHFREDLFYRLNVFPLYIPPLKERKDDVLILADYLLKKHGDRLHKHVNGFSESSIKSILDYDWPGNVRELENVIERSLILAKGDVLDNVLIPGMAMEGQENPSEMLMTQIDFDDTYKNSKQKWLNVFEKKYVSHYLKKYRGNITTAARYAGVSVKTFFRKMNALGLKKEDFK